jgi:integrase
MATVRRRGLTWTVQVRRRGFPTLTRTFQRKSDAELWARQREAEIDRGDLPSNIRGLRAHTLRQLLERYAETVTSRKRGADRERYKLRVILNHPIAALSLDRLTPAQIARYRDDRLTVVKGDTVRRELAIVQHCLELARKEWGIALLANPVRQIKLPSVGRSRERRTTAAELTQLLEMCGGKAPQRYWLPAMILLAVETGMRRGELLSLRWDDIDLASRTVHLKMTKNGHPRTVPLSGAALDVIRQIPRSREAGSFRQGESDAEHSPSVFLVTANAFRLAWERLKRKAGVTGLRFHDLRHEAVSRFFEKGLNVPEVASISGHRDPRMLMRYTHPKAEAIAQKLQ